MLEGNNISRLRCEFATELATPRPVLEGLVQPCGLLHGRDVFPGLVVTWMVSMMQRVEHAQSRVARRIQDLQHMRDAVVGLGDPLHPIPEFPAFGDEVVVRVDHQQRGDRLLVGQHPHDVLAWRVPPTVAVVIGASLQGRSRLFTSRPLPTSRFDYSGSAGAHPLNDGMSRRPNARAGSWLPDTRYDRPMAF